MSGDVTGSCAFFIEAAGALDHIEADEVGALDLFKFRYFRRDPIAFLMVASTADKQVVWDAVMRRLYE